MKKIKNDDAFDLAKKASQQPQEHLMSYMIPKTKLKIGIPKEITLQERRIPLTPSAVKMLNSYGFEILMETQAGQAAKFNDVDYSEAGAIICYDIKEVFGADIILKIAFPTFDEINLMKEGQMLFSAINLHHLEKAAIQALMSKNVTAFAYEYMRDSFGILSFVQSMSEIAGKAAIFIASEYLSGEKGKGLLMGGITGVPPAEVLIFGAGTVGQYAAKTALSLGSLVKVFDNSMYKLRRLRSFNDLNVFSSTLQPELIADSIKTADVVIGALRPQNGSVPCVLTEEMLMTMKENSILIDISIDQGGCFETSKVTSINNPVYVKHGVIHYCVPNIPAIVPNTASIALSNILSPMLIELEHASALDNYLWEEPHAREGIYIYKGVLTSFHIGNKFNLGGKSLDILLTSNL